MDRTDTDKADDKLLAAARELDRDVSPPRDLWPGVEQALRTPRRAPWRPMLAQAAAILLLIGATATITWFAASDEGQTVAVAPPALHVEFVSLAGPATLGDGYARARGTLVRQLDRELKRLPPETRADVERNLAVIRQAIADIDAALGDAPDNRLLQDLIVNAYREELAIMQRVGTLTNQLMPRQDI